MRNKLKKKIILATVCIISCFGLTGCSSGLQDFAESTLPQAIRDRGEANKQTASLFYSIGAISENQYKSICDNIDKQVEKYAPDADNGEIDGDTSRKILGTISGAVSKLHLSTPSNKLPSYVVGYDNDGNPIQFEGYNVNNSWDYYYGIQINNQGQKTGETAMVASQTNESWRVKPSSDEKIIPNFVMSNYLAFKTFDGRYSFNDGGYMEIPAEKIEPIQLISDDVRKNINQAVKAKLYILNSDMINTNDLNALDSVMANIQQTVNSNDKPRQKAAELSAFFTEARDLNNEPIYLIDPTNEEFDMVQTSKANDGSKNEPGYDLIIGQYDMNDCIHVRFTEFNTEALEKLNEFIGQNIQKVWLLQDGEGEWRAYLMAYPIEVIDSMQLCENNDRWSSYDWAKDAGGYSTVGIKFKQSGLGVNLMTGQFIKYKKTGSTFDYSDGELIDVDSGDLYLTLMSAQNNEADAISSLVVSGVSKNTIENSSHNEFTFYSGRIILRDYLEATYAPNYKYNENEYNLAVFGRKIRFNLSNENFKEDTSEVYHMGKGDTYQTVLVYERGQTVASFVDLHGKVVPESPTLEVTDFCDYSTLLKGKPSSSSLMVYRLPYKNEEGFTNDKKVESETPDIVDLSISNEKEVIRPVTWFPSPDIGISDYNADTKQKQRFYCIATTKGMFGSALYSSWVESTVPEANLDWWNEYLSSNGFSYKVEHTDIIQYLSDNFRYQLSQNGIVIIDLETVEKIQEMYDEEADQKRVGAIRTIFVILGWILIVGSFLLILLWVFDTNTDIGLGLLEKATFGNWVAVKYAEDITAHNVNDQKYVCFRDMCIRVMIMIAIGFILIRIDIYYILSVLIEIFGNIASSIEKLIKGRIG